MVKHGWEAISHAKIKQKIHVTRSETQLEITTVSRTSYVKRNLITVYSFNILDNFSAFFCNLPCFQGMTVKLGTHTGWLALAGRFCNKASGNEFA